jgi:hypothetical protein
LLNLLLLLTEKLEKLCVTLVQFLEEKIAMTEYSISKSLYLVYLHQYLVYYCYVIVDKFLCNCGQVSYFEFNTIFVKSECTIVHGIKLWEWHCGGIHGCQPP